MRGEIVLGHVLVADILEQHVGVHISGLLGDGERHSERLVEHEEAQSERRGHHLGKAACIQDAAFGVHRLDGRHVLAGKAQLAVRVVLKNGDIVLAREFVHLFTLFERGRDAGRVLEGRDRVQQLGLGVRLESGLERIRIHAVLLHRNADQLGAIRTECVQAADKGRVLGQNDIAFVYQNLGGQVGALLTAGQDEQLIVLEIKTLCAGEVVLHRIAQRRVALGQTVLQNRDRCVLHDVCDDVRNLGHREGLCGRVAAAKRDHVRVRAELEQLTDGRAVHIAHTVGNFILQIYRSC